MSYAEDSLELSLRWIVPLLPTGDLRKENWTVREISLDIARDLVKRYHYARGGSNTAVACHGLFHRDYDDECYGVTWWLPPTRSAAKATYPDDPNGVLSLSRLVIHPGAPRNAATFLLARSVKMLDPRWTCLVTYADTWQGHTGGIYRAANWKYVGLTKPKWVYVRDGRMMGPKRGPKTLSREQMLANGFEALGRFAKHKYVLMRGA